MRRKPAGKDSPSGGRGWNESHRKKEQCLGLTWPSQQSSWRIRGPKFSEKEWEGKQPGRFSKNQVSHFTGIVPSQVHYFLQTISEIAGTKTPIRNDECWLTFKPWDLEGRWESDGVDETSRIQLSLGVAEKRKGHSLCSDSQKLFCNLLIFFFSPFLLPGS